MTKKLLIGLVLIRQVSPSSSCPFLRRAAAAGVMNPEEIKRRKRQMAAVQQMKTQINDTMEERDHRMNELEVSGQS